MGYSKHHTVDTLYYYKWKLYYTKHELYKLVACSYIKSSLAFFHGDI